MDWTDELFLGFLLTTIYLELRRIRKAVAALTTKQDTKEIK
jgi:hypothetical protein